jgi:alkylation response protein AidB-like acyl-CoA dehydrogenase
MATTGSERGLTLRSPGRFMATAARLVELYQRLGDGVDPALRHEVTQAWMDAEAYQLYTLRDVTHIVDGNAPGARSSLNKLFWSEMDVRLHEIALRILGPRGELVDDTVGSVDGGAWMKGFEFALAGPIYAGTNEIQRNVVAERVLGLPRGAR